MVCMWFITCTNAYVYIRECIDLFSVTNYYKFYLKPLIKTVKLDYFNLSQQVNLHIQENCVTHVVMLNFFHFFVLYYVFLIIFQVQL